MQMLRKPPHTMCLVDALVGDINSGGAAYEDVEIGNFMSEVLDNGATLRPIGVPTRLYVRRRIESDGSKSYLCLAVGYLYAVMRRLLEERQLLECFTEGGLDVLPFILGERKIVFHFPCAVLECVTLRGAVGEEVEATRVGEAREHVLFDTGKSGPRNDGDRSHTGQPG